MYKDTPYWTVTESNVLSNDTIGIQNYVYMNKNEAESKLFRLWGYGANPDTGETRQLLSAYMTEHRGDRIILLEAKVFDYRDPEPVPPEWVQPGEEDPGYMIGDMVTHNDKTWVSTEDNNKNEPGVEGWNELTE